MRPKKSAEAVEQADRELLEHIRGLGLETVEAYRQWCVQHGFSKKLHKHWKQRCRERSHARQAITEQYFRQKKRERRNLAQIIAAICRRQLHADDVTEPHLKRLCQAVNASDGAHRFRHGDRRALLRMMNYLHTRRTKFFEGGPAIQALGPQPGNTLIEALVLAASHSDGWLRPVEDWNPRSHSVRRQFASLLRHLFVKYDDMPAFFDTVWFVGDRPGAAERREWYLHVGRGHSIRTCNLPLPLTRKMAHHFLRAPADATIEQALRWGQVHGLGGDEHLARAIFGSRLGDHFEHHEFWETVIRWLICHPLLDRSHVGPLVDYLHQQRFVPEHVYLAAGHREETPPPQPNLTMKGRTPDSLLRRVHEWHRRLSSDNLHQVRQWRPSGIREFEFLEGSEQGGNLKCWTIRELLSTRALVAEGRRMKHCVATYNTSCARGDASIWAMEVESLQGRTKALTVEVRNRCRQVCQARGKANRLPNEKERSILRRWATEAGLTVASYV